MIIPVRCVSCGRPVSSKWETFKQKVHEGENAASVLNELGLTSYCCRTLFLTHIDKLGDVAKFRV